MPLAGEVASLGLTTAGAGEDLLSSSLIAETTLGAHMVPDPPDMLSTSAPLTGQPSALSSASGSTSGEVFSLGHGFPLISAKMVNRIQK